jgi:hypothetical protein
MKKAGEAGFFIGDLVGFTISSGKRIVGLRHQTMSAFPAVGKPGAA